MSEFKHCRKCGEEVYMPHREYHKCESVRVTIKEIDALKAQLDAANARVKNILRTTAAVAAELDMQQPEHCHINPTCVRRCIDTLEELQPPADELTRLGQEMGEYD